jgi:hypothetical protein
MNRMRTIAARFGLFALMIVVSCTEVDLEPLPADPPLRRDDKLAVSGQLCTQQPETLTFPLRVMFIVDGSVSMLNNDPPDPITGETGRESAVRETWERLLDEGAEGVRFSVIRFSAQAEPLTSVDETGDGVADTYFTADRTLLDTATAALGYTDRTTNFHNALGEAYFQIRTELVAAQQESLPLSKYQVIFLSDGIPDTDSSASRGNTNEDVVTAVESLRELADTFKVGEFEFHTAYLAMGNQAFDQEASSLLRRMAEAGGGSFRSFPSGEALNFLFVDLTILRRIFTLKSLIAVNFNAVQDTDQIPEWAKMPIEEPDPADAGADADGGLDAGVDAGVSDAGQGADAGEDPAPGPSLHPLSFTDVNGDGYPNCGEPLADSDGDGLADLLEIELGTDPLVPDTDDDGLSDFIEWIFRDSGFDPLDPTDAQCYVPDICVDDDGDGECDCLFDSDADGVCDCVDDPDLACVDGQGRDCIDEDEDGFCDCPDRDNDGLCDYPDSDNDALNDCEEVFFGTSQYGVDTDADGMADLIEVRARTNAVVDDRTADLDADGTTNLIEVMSNTNAWCDDSAVRSRAAYQYTVEEREMAKGRTCYDFDIENITLLPTLANKAAEQPGNGWNRVLIYAGEVAFDAPGSFASYRVACVMANYHPDGNYKNPPSGRVALTEDDFVEISEFDPDEHCDMP